MKILDNYSTETNLVYFLGNQCLPNYFKIGKSMVGSLDSRLRSLSTRTAIPQPFDLLGVIIDEFGVGYCLEQQIFNHFQEFRVKNKEFFIFPNTDILFENNSLFNKTIHWNLDNVKKYSKRHMDIFNKTQEIKYKPTIIRQQKIIEKLFKERHGQEIKTNHIPKENNYTPKENNQIKSNNLLHFLKSMLF